jgi:dihydroneopterin aldolase
MYTASMDSTFLRGIELWTRLGVPEEERAKPQQVLVNIELHASLQTVARTDDVKEGIDYQKVVEAVTKLAKTERKTIERLAENIAEEVLKTFKPTGGITVTITKKPDLPLEHVSITIQRP